MEATTTKSLNPTDQGGAQNEVRQEQHKDKIFSLPPGGSWRNIITGSHSCAANNYSRPRTFNDILLTDFAVPHEWFYKDHSTDKWITGISNDLDSIIKLRNTDPASEEYERIKYLVKQTLQCYTPSGYYISKKKGQEILVYRIPIMQLDIDGYNYDIDEVQAACADLPWVCFCGKSASGRGLYALLLIDEPERLADYAEHCFYMFEKYGFPIDTGKGMNPAQLRFNSYDSNMFIRDFPKPLRIKRFNTRKITPKSKPTTTTAREFQSNDRLLMWAIREIQSAQKGQRFETVRKVAFTMGGHGFGLDEIKQAIKDGAQYTGVESKYLTHADECFADGQLKRFAA